MDFTYKGTFDGRAAARVPFTGRTIAEASALGVGSCHYWGLYGCTGCMVVGVSG